MSRPEGSGSDRSASATFLFGVSNSTVASAPPLANEAVGGAPAFFGGNSIARPWGRESSQALHRGGPPLWACASPPPTRVPLESLLRSEPATLNAAVAAVADSAFPAAASLGDAGVSSAIQKPHGGLLPQPPNPSSALASGEASCSSAPRGERASFFGVFKVAGAGLDASPVALSRNESSENAARSARFVAAQGRGRLYTPEGSAVPPPLPEARGSAANPLLRGDLQESDPLLRVQDVLQLQFQMAGRETAVSSAGGGGGIENGTQQNTNGFVGALLGYCSAEEMLDKQQVSTASDFERLDAVVPGDPEARIVNPYLAFSSFRRSDAGKPFKPETTRPAVWCRRAVHALLTYCVDADLTNGASSSEEGALSPKPYLFPRERRYCFLDVYNFVRDRLRACWQDLTVQHVWKHRAAIECLEISFRFLVLSEELLAGEEGFDPVSNHGLLQTCLDKLMQGYEAVRSFLQRRDAGALRARDSRLFDVLVFSSPYEGEFWAYKLLMLLGTDANEQSVVSLLQRLPDSLHRDPSLRFALDALRAFRAGSLPRYVSLMRNGPYLPCLLLHKFLPFARARLLAALVHGRLAGSRRNPLTLERMRRLMGFEGESETLFRRFLEVYGVGLGVSGRGAQVCVLESVSKALLADLSSFKKARSPHAPSNFLRTTPHGVSRQRLLDPDFPDASAATLASSARTQENCSSRPSAAELSRRFLLQRAAEGSSLDKSAQAFPQQASFPAVAVASQLFAAAPKSRAKGRDEETSPTRASPSAGFKLPLLRVPECLATGASPPPLSGSEERRPLQRVVDLRRGSSGEEGPSAQVQAAHPQALREEAREVAVSFSGEGLWGRSFKKTHPAGAEAEAPEGGLVGSSSRNSTEEASQTSGDKASLLVHGASQHPTRAAPTAASSSEFGAGTAAAGEGSVCASEGGFSAAKTEKRTRDGEASEAGGVGATCKSEGTPRLGGEGRRATTNESGGGQSGEQAAAEGAEIAEEACSSPGLLEAEEDLLGKEGFFIGLAKWRRAAVPAVKRRRPSLSVLDSKDEQGDRDRGLPIDDAPRASDEQHCSPRISRQSVSPSGFFADSTLPTQGGKRRVVEGGARIRALSNTASDCQTADHPQEKEKRSRGAFSETAETAEGSPCVVSEALGVKGLSRALLAAQTQLPRFPLPAVLVDALSSGAFAVRKRSAYLFELKLRGTLSCALEGPSGASDEPLVQRSPTPAPQPAFLGLFWKAVVVSCAASTTSAALAEMLLRVAGLNEASDSALDAPFEGCVQTATGATLSGRVFLWNRRTALVPWEEDAGEGALLRIPLPVFCGVHALQPPSFSPSSYDVERRKVLTDAATVFVLAPAPLALKRRSAAVAQEDAAFRFVGEEAAVSAWETLVAQLEGLFEEGAGTAQKASVSVLFGLALPPSRFNPAPRGLKAGMSLREGVSGDVQTASDFLLQQLLVRLREKETLSKKDSASPAVLSSLRVRCIALFPTEDAEEAESAPPNRAPLVACPYTRGLWGAFVEEAWEALRSGVIQGASFVRLLERPVLIEAKEVLRCVWKAERRRRADRRRCRAVLAASLRRCEESLQLLDEGKSGAREDETQKRQAENSLPAAESDSQDPLDFSDASDSSETLASAWERVQRAVREGAARGLWTSLPWEWTIRDVSGEGAAASLRSFLSTDCQRLRMLPEGAFSAAALTAAFKDALQTLLSRRRLSADIGTASESEKPQLHLAPLGILRALSAAEWISEEPQDWRSDPRAAKPTRANEADAGEGASPAQPSSRDQLPLPSAQPSSTPLLDPLADSCSPSSKTDFGGASQCLSLRRLEELAADCVRRAREEREAVRRVLEKVQKTPRAKGPPRSRPSKALA